MRILLLLLSLCLFTGTASAQSPVPPRSTVPGAHLAPNENARPDARLAQQALQRGDARSARLAAERAAERDPLSFDVQMLLGVCRLADGRYRDAYQAYARAGLLNPASADSYNRAGQILLQYLGRPAGAKAAFEQALRIDPKFAPAHFSLHYYHLLRGELTAAAESIDEASKNVRTDDEHFLYLGARHALSLYDGNYADALARLEMHVEQVAGDARAMQARALAHRLLGWQAEAEKDLRELIAVVRQPDPGLIVDLGLTLRAQGERDSARAYFQEALSLDPNRIEALYNMALESFAAGDAESAADLLNDCVVRHPADYAPQFMAGVVKVSAGDSVRAQRAHGAAYRRAPFSRAAAVAAGQPLLQAQVWESDTLMNAAETALLGGDVGVAAHKGIEACKTAASRPLGLVLAAAAKAMTPGSAGHRVVHLEAAREASAEASPAWLAVIDTKLAQAHDEIGNLEDAEQHFRAVLDPKQVSAGQKLEALCGYMAMLLREGRAADASLDFSPYESVEDARFWQLRAEWATALGQSELAETCRRRADAGRFLP